MAYAHNAGLNFYEGLVDVKPPLLIYLTSLGLRLSPSICFIKWLSVVIFVVLTVVVYLTLRFASGRNDIACLGAMLTVTNWSLRQYGIVELSQSYWQTMLCMFSLVTIFFSLSMHQKNQKFNAYMLVNVGIFLAAFLWAMAFCTKQQAIVVLPAVGALILLMPWSYPPHKAQLYYLGVFALGAFGSVVLLYYFLLGDSPVGESYKYIFLANMGGMIALNDYGWWSTKGAALTGIISASARIPIITFIGLEVALLKTAGARRCKPHDE
jgi:hypothetical protein